MSLLLPRRPRNAVGEAPLARGALAGLGGAGNADRLDVGGVGGGCRGEGFEVSDVGVFEAVEVVDEVVVGGEGRIRADNQCFARSR